MAAERPRDHAESPDFCSRTRVPFPSSVTYSRTSAPSHTSFPLPGMASPNFSWWKYNFHSFTRSFIHSTNPCQAPGTGLGAVDTKMTVAKSLLPRTSSPGCGVRCAHTALPSPVLTSVLWRPIPRGKSVTWQLRAGSAASLASRVPSRELRALSQSHFLHTRRDLDNGTDLPGFALSSAGDSQEGPRPGGT